MALVLAGALIWVGVTVTDFLSRRGASKVRFPPGETIFRQGDEGDFVYKIDEGEVEVIREIRSIRSRKARSSPGWDRASSSARRRCSATRRATPPSAP